MIIQPHLDPIGQAVTNYFYKQDNSPITVSSQVVEDEELPPDYFFRPYSEMPKLERIALKKSIGRVLDVGAGVGCHSLYLQKQNIDVTAIEVSELCCNLMKEQGLNKIVNTDILSYHHKQKYDTILLLMNGIGIAGRISGLKKLLDHLKKILDPNGKILLDSSDLIYLFEQEDGSFLLDINAKNYYGEIDYQLTYKKIIGQQFHWLFADHVILSEIAELSGFKTKVLEYGPHYDYLAELTLL